MKVYAPRFKLGYLPYAPGSEPDPFIDIPDEHPFAVAYRAVDEARAAVIEAERLRDAEWVKLRRELAERPR
jgi:hypothetical protein